MPQNPRSKAPLPAAVGEGSLRVGRLTKPHGLKGGIKIELYTDNPELRLVPGAMFHLQVPEESPWLGQTVSIRELRWFNGAPVAFFEEVPDRTAALDATHLGCGDCRARSSVNDVSRLADAM